MRVLFFSISEMQHNFRNELFNSVEAQRNFAIAERHFHTKKILAWNGIWNERYLLL